MKAVEGLKYHFVGVGGVGMSSVAQAALWSGHAVSGSDRILDTGGTTETLKQLALCGIELCRQDGSAVARGIDGVVVSTAIEKDNPDLLAAQKLGVPVLHRSEMLQKLIANEECLAVTGTCGKSTVTGMIGWILECAGRDPFVVNGAPIIDWIAKDRTGSTRHGKAGLWVIEADESDRSLINYLPDWVVVTNVSADHFGIEETNRIFKEFSARAKKGKISAQENPLWLTNFNPVLTADGSHFEYAGKRFSLPLPGRHNAENALFAVVACEMLGCRLDTAIEALRRFRGIYRRLQVVGTNAGIRVIDDYAHNPVKIEAAWRTVAPENGKIVAVWRPHGYGPLRNMMDGFADVFGRMCKEGNRVLLLPVYDAGGTANRDVNTDDLIRKIGSNNVELVGDHEAAKHRATSLAAAGDTILVMGARDPDLNNLALRSLGGAGRTEDGQAEKPA